MAEPTIQLGGGNWAGKSGNLLGYYEQNKKFYAEDFTFSRSTTGTYTDKDGYIQEMPYNLLQYSEDYSQIYWRKDKLTATANSATSPSGLTDAFLIQETTYTNSVPSFDLQSSNTLSVGTYTFSFYVKNNNGRYLGISFGSSGERVRTNFDFNTNTFKTLNLSGSTTGSASYTTLGDYYRISVTATFPSSVGADVVLMPLETDTYPFFAFQDSDNRSFYLWGVQLVKGTSAKTYFPTTTRLNMPRVDYLNNSNGSLILEPQRTNYCKNSEYKSIYDYNDSVTVEDVDIVTPYGITSNAVKINSVQGDNSPIRAAGATALSQQFSQNDVITISGYVKYNEGFRYVQFGGYFGSESARFDLQEGVVIQNLTNVISSSITPFGNDWYRVVVTYTFQDSISNGLLYAGWVLSTNTSFSFTNAPIGSIYAWGVQIELASYPTSYIPTSGSSVTRNADACSITNVADRIGQTEGTLYSEFDLTEDNNFTLVEINLGNSVSDRILAYRNASYIQFIVQVGGYIEINNSTLVTFLDTNKIAITYQTDDFKIYLNGSLVKTYTSGSIPSSLDTVALQDPNLLGKKQGIKSLILFKEILSDTELTALTTI